MTGKAGLSLLTLTMFFAAAAFCYTIFIMIITWLFNLEFYSTWIFGFKIGVAVIVFAVIALAFSYLSSVLLSILESEPSEQKNL